MGDGLEINPAPSCCKWEKYSYSIKKRGALGPSYSVVLVVL
jgi:hypothetical protein